MFHYITAPYDYVWLLPSTCTFCYAVATLPHALPIAGCCTRTDRGCFRSGSVPVCYTRSYHTLRSSIFAVYSWFPFPLPHILHTFPTTHHLPFALRTYRRFLPLHTTATCGLPVAFSSLVAICSPPPVYAAVTCWHLWFTRSFAPLHAIRGKRQRFSYQRRRQAAGVARKPA